MSRSIKFLFLAGLVSVAAACAQQDDEEFVVVQPEPITAEPVYTGKYK